MPSLLVSPDQPAEIVGWRRGVTTPMSYTYHLPVRHLHAFSGVAMRASALLSKIEQRTIGQEDVTLDILLTLYE